MNSKKSRRETIELLLKGLQKASSLVDSVTERTKVLKDDFNVSDFRFKTAKALSLMYELEADLFDLEPTLVPDYLKPSLEPIDLSNSLERLSISTNNLVNQAIKQSTINEFKNYMSDRVTTKFTKAIVSGKEYEFAKLWCDNRPKPFIPVVKVYKQLKSNRLSIRFYAAKLLEEKFKVRVWDNNKNEVVSDRIDKFMFQWLNDDF